jgi:hypothetical protein
VSAPRSCSRRIAEAVASLLASGHVVVLPDGEVGVYPPVPDDTFDLLQSCWHDVERVLSVGPGLSGAATGRSGGDS